MKKNLLLAITLLLFVQIQAQNKRYKDAVFTSSTVTTDVVYDTAPFLNAPYLNEGFTSDNDLVLDIYEPTGDVHNLRPVILFVHAGGFALGNRNHDDMVAFCDSFARMGYVTATMDYRKGFYVLSNADLHSTRAAYRGLQDGRSAIRYLRANATTYGIDPSKVYIAGSSAGAFVALHSIYMTAPNEKPPFAEEVDYSNLIFPFFYTAPDLGPVDRGSNLGQSGTPNAVISLWGAVNDLALISPADAQPIFLAHGSSDSTVPYDSGSPFGIGIFPTVYGSNQINNTLTNNGFTNKETYLLPNEEHEFYGTSNGTWVNGTGGNMHWDSILNKSTDFLWQQHKPSVDFTFVPNALTVAFTDQTPGAVAWFWDFGDGNTSTLQNPIHNYGAEGGYDVSLLVQNNILSCDEVEKSIDVILAPVPLSWLSPLNAVYRDGQTALTWTVAEQFQNERFVIQHSSDGRVFSEIGELAAGENIFAEMTYHFKHDEPHMGANYYRVKQLDWSGEFSYSSVAVLAIGAIKASFSFYPNPAFDHVNITSSQSGAQWLDLYSMQGVLLKSLLLEEEGRMDLQDLPGGTYLLRNRVSGTSQRILIGAR